jgi:hypothetical protein
VSEEWKIKNVNRQVIDQMLMDSIEQGDKVAALLTESDLDAIMQAFKIALTVSDVGNVSDKWRDMLKARAF